MHFCEGKMEGRNERRMGCICGLCVCVHTKRKTQSDGIGVGGTDNVSLSGILF